MFDVGFAEILLLSLVGLMVLGPERLPKVARTLGGLARRARGSWMNLKRSIEAELRAEELKTPLKHFEKEIKSTVDRVKSGVDSMKDFDPTTPGSSKPDSTKPDSTKPDSTKPDSTKPDSTKPGSAEKPGGTDDSS